MNHTVIQILEARQAVFDQMSKIEPQAAISILDDFDRVELLLMSLSLCADMAMFVNHLANQTEIPEEEAHNFFREHVLGVNGPRVEALEASARHLTLTSAVSKLMGPLLSSRLDDELQSLTTQEVQTDESADPGRDGEAPQGGGDDRGPDQPDGGIRREGDD